MISPTGEEELKDYQETKRIIEKIMNTNTKIGLEYNDLYNMIYLAIAEGKRQTQKHIDVLIAENNRLRDQIAKLKEMK